MAEATASSETQRARDQAHECVAKCLSFPCVQLIQGNAKKTQRSLSLLAPLSLGALPPLPPPLPLPPLPFPSFRCDQRLDLGHCGGLARDPSLEGSHGDKLLCRRGVDAHRAIELRLGCAALDGNRNPL